MNPADFRRCLTCNRTIRLYNATGHVPANVAEKHMGHRMEGITSLGLISRLKIWLWLL